MSKYSPASDSEAADIVKQLRAQRTPVAIEGGGTRAGLGRPMQTAATLSSKNLSGIVFYEPAEMVVCARAGTPIAQIDAALAEHGQMLPFEPMDHRGLFGSQGEPTIGAIAACNISGPRRIRNGAARDALLGVKFINGLGETLQSGGRVMKNVTGLDLVKLQCGACGTLGFLTETTFKLIPQTQSSGSLALEGLDEARAVAAMSAALGSPFEVSGAAFAPGKGVYLRIEHFSESVDYRLRELETLLRPFGAGKRIDRDESEALWRNIRDAEPLGSDREEQVWRVSVAPSRAPAFLAALRTKGFAPGYFLDWGGGLIWLELPAGADGAKAIRTALAATGGHATLVRAPVETRQHCDVFQPLPEAAMKLSRGVKASFDPDRIFNPGRMYADV